LSGGRIARICRTGSVEKIREWARKRRKELDGVSGKKRAAVARQADLVDPAQDVGCSASMALACPGRHRAEA
jgi:hypothetical protein